MIIFVGVKAGQQNRSRLYSFEGNKLKRKNSENIQKFYIDTLFNDTVKRQKKCLNTVYGNFSSEEYSQWKKLFKMNPSRDLQLNNKMNFSKQKIEKGIKF